MDKGQRMTLTSGTCTCIIEDEYHFIPVCHVTNIAILEISCLQILLNLLSTLKLNV